MRCAGSTSRSAVVSWWRSWSSGSGESTLLTIASSMEEPTSGQVLVAGTDL